MKKGAPHEIVADFEFGAAWCAVWIKMSQVSYLQSELGSGPSRGFVPLTDSPGTDPARGGPTPVQDQPPPWDPPLPRMHPSAAPMPFPRTRPSPGPTPAQDPPLPRIHPSPGPTPPQDPSPGPTHPKHATLRSTHAPSHDPCPPGPTPAQHPSFTWARAPPQDSPSPGPLPGTHPFLGCMPLPGPPSPGTHPSFARPGPTTAGRAAPVER